MFCPVCRDEYRRGFTRCATCDVELVESLDAAPPEPEAPRPLVTEVAAQESTVNFCGYLTLEEAREARDKVRARKMRAEILVCEPPGTDLSGPVEKEEYWLRVTPREFRAVADLLGYAAQAQEAAAEETFNCSACGAVVASSDTECPGCGLSFEG